MARKKTIQAFTKGTHNKFDKEIIPEDASSDSLGWMTRDGHIELMYGRQAVGGDGDAGKIWNEEFGKKTDGTSVHFRKIWDGTEGKIQYLNGSTWTDTITGLSNSYVTFTPYTSLAGNFMYISGPEDGIFKIITANPGSYADVYNSTKNFKGYSRIDQGRMFMWYTENDRSGLYGSHIDSQDSDVYTTVSAEAIGSSGSTNYTGTLAFKAGGSTRTCFGVVFTDGTSSITIDFTGTATSASAGSGTVNMMTGAYDVTFDAPTVGSVTASYQWEDSNAGGVTDFTKSATRAAGEGFIIRQDAGGDAIQTFIPYEGSYFSIKENSVYQFTLDAEDTNPTNKLIRTNIGCKTPQAAIGTGAGIVFLDTGNPTDPDLILLQRNPFGDNITTEPIFPHFDFSKYNYDDVALESWDQYVVVACKENTDDNNRILLADVRNKTVDIANYDVRCFSTDGGFLYGGSPVVQTVYELFTGFDDMEGKITNYWISKADNLGDTILKKVKKYRVRGQISPEQSIKIYVRPDNDDKQHIGTILGTGEYVDYNTTYAIGTNIIGQSQIGGEATATVYDFLIEIKTRYGKFRNRQIEFEATGFGYCNIKELIDYDIWTYQEKIPSKYRVKQNVSLDGETTNQNNPEY